MNKRDGVWTVGATALGAIFQILQMVVAARYLSAADFGALAIASLSINVVAAFQEMGLSSFCVYIGDADRKSHSTLFWISSSLGLVGTIVMLLLAGPLSSFYQIPRSAGLLQLVAFNMLLVGISGQYQANLVRTFRARRLAQFEIVGRLVAFSFTVGLLTLHLVGPEAIMLGMIAFTAVKLMLMVLGTRREDQPRLEFDRALAPRAFRFGASQAGSQVVSQLRAQADQIIVAAAFSAATLGYYFLAKELISYPTRFMQPLIARLTLPFFARLQSDAVGLRSAFLASVRRTSTLSGIVFAFVAITAPWLIEIMYGLRFIDAAPLVIALCVFGAVRPIGLSIGMLAQATGRSGHEFRWTLASSTISVLPLLVIAQFHPAPLAFAVATSVLQVVITLAAHPFFVAKLEPVPFGAYIQNAWVGLFIALTGALIGSFLNLPSLHSIYALLAHAKLLGELQ